MGAYAMDFDLKRFLRERYQVSGLVAPGRFESELAKRIGTPKKRKPVLAAWQAYLGEPGREAVRRFYGRTLEPGPHRLEALVYALHYPFLQFYARVVPGLLPAGGRVLEVGAYTGALVHALALQRPELEWHALEPLPEAVRRGERVGRELGLEVRWHADWWETFEPTEPYDAVLLLSVLPEGHLRTDLPPEFEDDAAFYRTFELCERLERLGRALAPGGRVLYGHGPFLGKHPAAFERLLEAMGFEAVERHGSGDYVLIAARRGATLREARSLGAHRTAPDAPTEEPSADRGERARAALAAGDARAALALLEGVEGDEAAELRGRALAVLGRWREAEAALARAAGEEARDLRARALVELGRGAEALERLERRAARDPEHMRLLARAYAQAGREADALRAYARLGNERSSHLQAVLERFSEKLFRDLRAGRLVEVSRRVEFAEDLSPDFLTRELLYLGLHAALGQRLWARAERYARRLYDLGEVSGAVGLALAHLRIRDVDEVETIEQADLEAVEPYLTDAVARSEEPLALMALGRLRYEQGRYPEARRLLEQAARAARGAPVGAAYRLLAEVLERLEAPLPEVLGAHKRAHAFHPYPPARLLELAERAAEAGEEVLAREFLGALRETGLAELPRTRTGDLVRLIEALEGAWEAFRVLWDALARTPGAGPEVLEQAYRLSRPFAAEEEAERALAAYVGALNQRGRAEEALAVLRDEAERRPHALGLLFDLAEQYERLARFAEAQAVWKRALEAAYYQEKDLELAREVLRNLLFLNPHDPELELYLAELKATSAKLAELEGAPDALAGQTTESVMTADLPRFSGEYLIVLGGHTQLRSRLKPRLEALGLRVDWFDSDSTTAARESLRRIQSRLSRAHGVIIVSSYVGHDLSEPVRAEALARGVPVYITPGRARGVTGLVRALAEFAPEIIKKAIG